jgi:hypothetical protein
MSRLLKAEASLEFMTFFGILLLFFVFFLGIVGTNNRDIQESTISAKAENVLGTVVEEINTASRIEGYHREFSLPSELPNGNAYTISYNTTLRIVQIMWGSGRNVIRNIVTNNVSGNIVTGYNRIENLNGKVRINEG